MLDTAVGPISRTGLRRLRDDPVAAPDGSDHTGGGIHDKGGHRRLAFALIQLIGIGIVVFRPLPHHRTCGSASGGSGSCGEPGNAQPVEAFLRQHDVNRVGRIVPPPLSGRFVRPVRDTVSGRRWPRPERSPATPARCGGLGYDPSLPSRSSPTWTLRGRGLGGSPAAGCRRVVRGCRNHT